MATIYYLNAGGHVLTAYDLDELAQLVECAVDARDPIRSVETLGGFPLSDEEFRELLDRLLPSTADAFPR